MRQYIVFRIMNFGDNVQIKGCQIKARFLESSSGNASLDNLLGGNSSLVPYLQIKISRSFAQFIHNHS